METLVKWDEELFTFLNQMGSESWDGFWLIVTDQWMSIPIYAILMLLLWKHTGFKATVVHFIFIMGIVGFTLVLSRLVKYGIARPRPCNPLSGLENIRFPLGKDCGDFGFFSTHASVGLGIMIYIGKTLKPYYKYILWVLLTWVALFCYSRIYVGKHYPGDIIVGLLIGLIIGLVAFVIRQKVRDRFKI